MSFSMSRDEFAAYLDSVRITGKVATARENNLDHIQGFLDGNEHLEFGVQWTRDWDYDSVFEVMVRRAGLNPDRSHTHGQDTIGAEQCISALEEYARIFGEAVRASSRILFATGHPAGLFPIYAVMAAAAKAAGAEVQKQNDLEPIFLGQMHGAELPRASFAYASHSFLKKFGGTYRPHPSEKDKLSVLTHQLWEKEGIHIDRSGTPLNEVPNPVVSIFSTGVLEAAIRGIPAWVYHPAPPAWLVEFWDRYGMNLWGQEPTPAPVQPKKEPAQRIAELMIETLEA